MRYPTRDGYKGANRNSMKLNIIKRFHFYYIILNTFTSSDWDVCSYLDLPLEEYRNILRSHGARQYNGYTDMYFISK